MHNENYSIIFSSMTGNTRKLADKIRKRQTTRLG